MADLSPAAQAVLDAVALAMEGGWISPEFTPYEARKAAAALRAAAYQVVPKCPEPKWSTGAEQARWFACDDVRAELLAIAAELEGADQSTKSTH